MKVLAFNSSPRKSNSVTEILMKQFLEGAQESGADIEKHYITDLNINDGFGFRVSSCGFQVSMIIFCVLRTACCVLGRNFFSQKFLPAPRAAEKVGLSVLLSRKGGLLVHFHLTNGISSHFSSPACGSPHRLFTFLLSDVKCFSCHFHYRHHYHCDALCGCHGNHSIHRL